jgi:iron complex outermembrane receptor protein
VLTTAPDVVFAADAVHFDIPRQPANTALTSFAQQAGISVLFPFDTVSGVTANKLVGEHTVADGVQILLEGLGLESTLKAGHLTVRVAEKGAVGPMRDANRSIFRALATTLLFGAKGVAVAQDDEQRAGGLEEIVVTARFREENLQEIPLAVSAFTAETLAANGATSVLDVAAWTPNVTFDQLGQGYGPTVAANIRGLGYGDFKATSEPTVTFYVDDVVLGRPTGAIMDLLDLDRVEVLRGPQGTLFGKNAIGGVVRMISRKPGADDGIGTMELSVGSYDRLDVRGSFETTLVEEKLFSRIAFVSKTRDGYMDNVDYRCAMIRAGTPQLAGVGDGIVGWDRVNNVPIMGAPFSREDNNFAVPTRVSEHGSNNDCIVGRLGDQDTKAARVMLRFTPNDRFELNVAADITEQNETSPYELTSAIGNPILAQRYNQLTGLPTYGVPYDSRFAAPDIHTTYAGFDDAGRVDGGIATPNVNDVTHWGTSATLDVDLEAVAIKLIVARREFDALFGQDADGSPLAYNHFTNDLKYDQDSVELRVSGSLFNGRTTWTAGYFSLESLDLGSTIAQQVPCVNSTSCIDRVDYVWVDNSAVFANSETDLTDKLLLSVGLRNSDDGKEILQERYDRLGAYCCGFGIPTIVTAESSRTDPMVSLTYSLAEQVRVYGTYQEGFRGGGTTARPTATTRIPFGPETLKNREIGIKADLFGDRVRLNASVFDMSYEDIQQNAAGLDELGQPSFVTTNAGEASITGYEIETRVSVGDHWSVDGSVGHLDYQLTDLGNASPEALLAAGLNPANAPNINDGPNRTPRYTASLNLGYYLNMPSGAGFSVRLGASWRDDAWWGLDGDMSNPTNKVPAHTLSNFRVTWASPGDQWEAALFCTNCSDVRTTSSRLDFLALTGHLSETYIRPEEWGMSIRRAF